MASKKEVAQQRRRSEKLGEQRYRMGTLVINGYERLYAETSNPLYVWEAIRLYRRLRLLMPAWVAAYLETTSEMLLQRARKGSSDQAAEIAAALGFRGKSTGFSEYRKFQGSYEMLTSYLQLRQDGKSRKDAFDELASANSLKDGRTVEAKIKLFLAAVGSDLSAVEGERWMAV